MAQVGNWIWDDTNKVWVKLAGTAGGAMSIHAIVEELNDVEDVNAPAPGADEVLTWDAVAGEWIAAAAAVGAHKDTHDPEDGADPLDTAAPVKVGAANAIGDSHFLARANHVHEREHEKYTDANAVTAMGVLGDANPLNHDRAAEWGAAEHTAIGDAAPHHAKYLDAAALAAAVQAGAITNAVLKAPTHDAVFDVKATADGAMPSADDAAAAVTAMGVKGDANPLHHDIYADADAVSAMGVKGDANPLHHDIYADADAVDAIEADGNLPVASITFIIDGGGSAITTGIKGALEIPFACTINRVTLLADQSGSIVIDIWKQAYADYPPENANSIVSAAPPTITTAEKSQDSTLTGWTTAIAAGDCLMFNVDSITTCTWVTLSLKVTKT